MDLSSHTYWICLLNSYIINWWFHVVINGNGPLNTGCRYDAYERQQQQNDLMIVLVLEQLGLEAESSYSTSLPRNFPPSRDVAMGDRPMVCISTTTNTTTVQFFVSQVHFLNIFTVHQLLSHIIAVLVIYLGSQLIQFMWP